MKPPARHGRRSAAGRGRLLLLLGLAAGASAACGGDGGGADAAAIDRDTFVATYVDLRRASLDAGGGAIEAAERERILGEHGVTEEDLLRFADVHGPDVTYMRGVWDEVQARLEPPSPPADTAPPAASG